MTKLRYNNAIGTLGAALSASSPTIVFANPPSFATIVSPDYIPITIDPPMYVPNSKFEIVYLTAYTAGATSGTISRAQEGTPPANHDSGATWVCAPTVIDYPPRRILAAWGGTMPTAPGPNNVWRVPYDGSNAITYAINRLFARIETPAATSVSFAIEKSPGGGSQVFTPTTIASVTISSGQYEAEVTAIGASVNSGDLLRLKHISVVASVVFQVELSG